MDKENNVSRVEGMLFHICGCSDEEAEIILNECLKRIDKKKKVGLTFIEKSILENKEIIKLKNKIQKFAGFDSKEMKDNFSYRDMNIKINNLLKEAINISYKLGEIEMKQNIKEIMGEEAKDADERMEAYSFRVLKKLNNLK